MLVFGLAVLIGNPSTTTVSDSVYGTTSPTTIELSSTTIKSFIRHYSELYGVSYNEMYLTIDCESGFNTHAVNPNDPSYGIAQFTPPTFYHFAPLAGIQKPDIGSTTEQLQTMAFMFSIGKADRWTCHRLIFDTPLEKG